MTLYLFRHGIAIDRDHPRCPPDAQRRLTRRGHDRTQAAARGLVALRVSPDRVFSSPYLRALETAEIAARTLRAATPEIAPELEPAGDPAEFLARLTHVKGDVLAIGHAPHLDLLLATVLGLRRPRTRLKKAGAAKLVLAATRPGGAHLDWILTPLVLREIGRKDG